jgi:putative ABC transport system permease protein
MMTRHKLLKPRWRKVLADLWEGKTRTLLVVASIAAGVFAIGAIITTYVILDQDLSLSYALIHPANIEMVTTPFEEDFLRSVVRIPGIKSAEGRQSLSVRASKDGVNWLSLNLLAARDFNAAQINQLKPVAGATIPGEHELLIGYQKVRDSGFRTGDWLQVELPDDMLRSMRVAGEVSDLTSSHDPFGTQRGFVTEDTLVWLGGTRLYNRLLVTANKNVDDKDYIQSVADAVITKFKKNGGSVYRTSVYKSNEFPMATVAITVLSLLSVLGILVLLLSSSLIVNTLNAMFAQHLHQIGVMKLVGARGEQVLGMYLLMILSYALLALLIAVPLGVWAGYELARVLADMFNATLQGFRIIPAAVAIQVGVAICVPLAAGILPVRNSSKISVEKAINNDQIADTASHAGLPVGLNRLGVSLLSRPVLLSIRNTFRRKGRLLLTLFTLIMAGAIFIAVFNVIDSLDIYLNRLMQHFMADVTLTFDRSYRTERVVQVAMQIPGVEKVEAWSGASAEILDPQDNLLESLNIIAPPADTLLLKADMIAGRWLLPGDQRSLIVSSVIYKVYPNLKPGDTLRLRVAGGNIEEWAVVGVFSFLPILGDLMGYANYDYISDLLGTPRESSSFRLVTNAHTLGSQKALSEAIDHHMRSQNFQVQNVEAGMVTRKQASQALNLLMTFLLFMALLTAFVGSIGLTGTMGMNVLERTREIGVMRAIGAVDLAIIKSVVIEGVLIGSISWGSAWALSYPISIMMLNIISASIQSEPIALSYTLKGVIVWLGVVILLSAVSSMLPARNASRLTIREVLAYE